MIKAGDHVRLFQEPGHLQVADGLVSQSANANGFVGVVVLHAVSWTFADKQGQRVWWPEDRLEPFTPDARVDPFHPVNVQDLLREVHEEVKAQHVQWGTQDHPDCAEDQPWSVAELAWQDVNTDRAQQGTLTWDGILAEELAEACAADTDANRITELIQVAAVAVSWAQAIRRRRRDAR